MAKIVEIGENDSILKGVRMKRHRPLTNIWVGTMMGELAQTLGRDPGERTVHAIAQQIRDMHAAGVKADVAGRILAYQIQEHSRLKRQIGELTAELERLKRGEVVAPPKATPPKIIKGVPASAAFLLEEDQKEQ